MPTQTNAAPVDNGSVLSKMSHTPDMDSSLRDERLPEGPRFANESPDADTGCGSGSQKLTHSPQFPFLDLKAQYRCIREEVQAAIQRVLESQHFILGPEVQQFEAEVAQYIGSKYCISCASGSDALLLALMALGVGSGDEVITSPFTFGATLGAIARAGARPVLVDIDWQTCNIDADQIEAAVTSRTRAIMPVHLFGLMADMGSIMQVATRHGLGVIEDAAQAIGAQQDGQPSGTIGQAGCFSFFPSKNLGGAGDGGLTTTQDADIADRLRIMRTHGSRRKYEYEIPGFNSRLDALQAAVLRVKLRHLSAWTAARQRNADRYRELASQYGLENIVDLPVAPPGRAHVYNQFCIRAKERDALRQYLTASGIPTEIYYPHALHLQPAFASLGYGTGDFPQAEATAREVLALPIYPELTEAQQRAVIEAIAAFYKAGRTAKAA